MVVHQRGREERFPSSEAQEVQERSAELTVSTEALQAARGQIETLTLTLNLLAAEPERDRFIGQVLKAITDQLRAHSGGFWLYDRLSQTSSLHLDYNEGDIQFAEHQNSPAILRYRACRISEPLLGTTEQTERQGCILCEDIANDPGLVRCQDYLLTKGITSLFLIPLFLEDEFIGRFSIHSTQPRLYSPEEIELAQALAQQAVLAIQMARLAEQSRQAAVLEERNRLAREIHDTLAQAFTGMLIQLGVAQRIARQQPEEAWVLIEHVSELARQGLAEARRSVWALQPESLEYSNLADTLPRTVAQMISDIPLQAQVLVHGTPRSLPSDVGMNLLRIGQEALNNAIHHARARNIFLELTFDAAQVRLCIQDDGQGFDPRHQEEGGGFGLIGMRQRTERIRGQLTITTQAGRGTEVAVTAPIAPPCEEEAV